MIFNQAVEAIGRAVDIAGVLAIATSLGARHAWITGRTSRC